jgi:hypothetical protein
MGSEPVPLEKWSAAPFTAVQIRDSVESCRQLIPIVLARLTGVVRRDLHGGVLSSEYW